MKNILQKIILAVASIFLISAIFLEFQKNKTFNFTPSYFIDGDKASIKEKNTIIVKSEESVIIDVVDKALPSVVTIGIKLTRQGRERVEIDPFDPFGPFRTIPGEDRVIESNIGSGFIVSENGIIITNKHVVNENDAEYTVITSNNQKYAVSKIYRDPLNDLAILKINANGLTALSLGDSSKLKLGQKAIAIGTPFGEFQNTITSGIVSGLGRGITAGSPFEGFVERLDSVIQTDAAISSGNSGGPLLNSSAEVIGVNTAVSNEGENIGFAIPVNVVKELLENFEARGGSFDRPYIGIRYSMIDAETAKTEKLSEGAYIERVEINSPAEKAGLERGDTITSVDGKKLIGSDDNSVVKAIVQKKVGDIIKVEYIRDGRSMTVNITLAAYVE
jgi:serine protease Do